MEYRIEEMSIDHYEDVMALWKASEGVVLSSVDSRENIKRFLERNSGMSFIVMDSDKVVGAVLCSHDGRMGYLTHLAVDKAHRRKGLGRSLVGRCLYTLMSTGISKCTLLVMEYEAGAMAFWESIGLKGRVDLLMMSPREEGSEPQS
jgi:ribosomal protein S18 acetylase RimI-like enzyme